MLIFIFIIIIIIITITLEFLNISKYIYHGVFSILNILENR